MLRMNFISLLVTNSADGGRRSYPKLSKCKQNRWFPPHTPLGGAAAALGVCPPVGECCPLVGVPPSATTEFRSFRGYFVY